MQISAYIPCYNGAATLAKAIESVRRQELAVDELFVVDNGSSDDPARIAEAAGVRVVRMKSGLGRGAARDRAMQEAKHPLVACCDSSIELPEDFLAKAIPWFENSNVAAVGGRVSQQKTRTIADRWRERHLFRTEKRTLVMETAPFATGGAIVRASAVREIGGYDPGHYDGEDADLGRRLVSHGYKVIFDPELIYWQLGSNSILKVLERYWRWNKGRKRMSLGNYLRQINYAITVLAREDLEMNDPGAAIVSLLSPHYQFLRDLLR